MLKNMSKLIELKESDFRPRPETWLKSCKDELKKYREQKNIKYLHRAMVSINALEKSLTDFSIPLFDQRTSTILQIRIDIHTLYIKHYQNLLGIKMDEEKYPGEMAKKKIDKLGDE